MMRSQSYRRTDVARIQERARSLAEARGNWPEDVLPLSDASYLVLVTLEAPAQSAFGSLASLEGDVRIRALPPGTLQKTVLRLVEQGLVADCEGSARPWRLTELGAAVLYAESGRRRRHAAPSFAEKLRGTA